MENEFERPADTGIKVVILLKKVCENILFVAAVFVTPLSLLRDD